MNDPDVSFTGVRIVDGGAEASDVLDGEDLVLDLSVRSDDGGCLALFLSNQGTGERGADRDQAPTYVGFHVTDDLVSHLCSGRQTLEIDRRAEDDPPAPVDGGGIDDLRGTEPSLDLRNPPFDEALLLPRGMVLGVLAEIPVRPGFRERAYDLRPRLALELLQLPSKPLRSILRQRTPVHDPAPMWISCIEFTAGVSGARIASTSARAPAIVVKYGTRCCNAVRLIA